MAEAPQDDGFGRAVRLATGRMSARVQECPAAEDLAAFVDEALEDDEQAAVVAHLAACARCQGVVTAVLRHPATSDQPSAAPRRAGGDVVAFPAQRSRHMWRWVAPVAAATAAVLAWVAVRPMVYRRQPRPAEDSALARREAPRVDGLVDGAPSPGGAAGQVGDRQAPVAPTQAGNAAVGPPSERAARAATTGEASARVGPAPVMEASTEARPVVPVPAVPQGSPQGVARVPAAPVVSPGTDGAPGAADAPVGAAVPSSTSPAATAPAAPMPSGPTRTGADAAPPLAGRAERSVSAERSGTAPGQARAAAGNASSGFGGAGESGGRYWRSNPGTFEWSADGGRTWQSVALPSRAEVRVAASPNPDIWWLAGRGGGVLRVLRGQASQLTLPTSADVVALEAADRARALVRTADGGQYETRDEGRTWRSMPTR